MELKPCPFCGGKAIVVEIEKGIEKGNYRAGCNNIHCRGDWFRSVYYPTKAKAIKGWNERVDNGRSERVDSGSWPFLVWDDTGDLLITLGGIETWDVTEDGKRWVSEFGLTNRTCHAMPCRSASVCTVSIDGKQADLNFFTCSECGSDNLTVARYCMMCGAKVTES